MIRAIPVLSLALFLGGCVSQTYGDCPNDRVSWQAPADRHKALVVLPNVIRVQLDGPVLWNDRPVTPQELSTRLLSAGKLEPTPQTVLIADENASCAAVEQVRDEIEKRIGCEDGRCAEATSRK